MLKMLDLFDTPLLPGLALREPLGPRSIYHMSGEARRAWEHSIAPMAVPRWSVTFRSLA